MCAHTYTHTNTHTLTERQGETIDIYSDLDIVVIGQTFKNNRKNMIQEIYKIVNCT